MNVVGGAAAPSPGLAWRSLAVDLALTLALWLVYAACVGHGGPFISYDSLRDIAGAQALLLGRWGVDPSLPGLPAWYPPGEPSFFAGLSRLTHVPVLDLVATSPYWLGWVLPVSILLVVRSTWGRRVAWLSIATVVVGSTYWTRHLALPIPSVHGVALGLLAVGLWVRGAGAQAARGWTLASAVMVALTLWVHPLCGAMALGTILLHAAVDALARRAQAPGEPRSLSRCAWLTGIALLGGSPVIVQQLRLPRLNPAPQHWFAPELHDPGYALHAHTPLIVPIGIAGLVFASRRWRTGGWLVCYFAIGLAGQLAGYAGHDLGWPLPWALPHEFQWHGQIALMIAAALGVDAVARQLTLRSGRGIWSRSPALRASAVVAVALGSGLAQLRDVGAGAARLDATWTTTLAAARSIGTLVPPDAVVACSPDVAYLLTALTGRRCVVLPAGHMNPAADHPGRLRAVNEMLTTTDPAVLGRLAARYQAAWLLLAVPHEQSEATRERYARWPNLEEVPVVGGGSLLYRITTERTHAPRPSPVDGR